eukprot:COSAG02_NODE_992_length_15399_cov_164.326797_1_plen_105_part_00
MLKLGVGELRDHLRHLSKLVTSTRSSTELCVLRTFGGVDFSLIFICVQSVSEFLWDRLRASSQFPVMPKRAQYARFSGENGTIIDPCSIVAALSIPRPSVTEWY